MPSLVLECGRAALVGVASGCRSVTGLAVLTLTAPPAATGRPDAVLTRPATRTVVSLAALGELVGDKLPAAPSRLEPPGLAARLVTAAACGAILARRDRPGSTASLAASVATATAAAGGSAWIGARARGRAGATSTLRGGIAAVAEDAIAVGSAVLAARSATAHRPRGAPAGR